MRVHGQDDASISSIDVICCRGPCKGLARTLFMEDRARCGPAIDLPVPGSSGQLPTAAQLAHLAMRSSEFALAWRANRPFGLRLAPAIAPAPRHAAMRAPVAAVVAGGTKARMPALHPNISVPLQGSMSLSL